MAFGLVRDMAFRFIPRLNTGFSVTQARVLQIG